MRSLIRAADCSTSFAGESPYEINYDKLRGKVLTIGKLNGSLVEHLFNAADPSGTSRLEYSGLAI